MKNLKYVLMLALLMLVPGLAACQPERDYEALTRQYVNDNRPTFVQGMVDAAFESAQIIPDLDIADLTAKVHETIQLEIEPSDDNPREFIVWARARVDADVGPMSVTVSGRVPFRLEWSTTGNAPTSVNVVKERIDVAMDTRLRVGGG